MKNEISTLRWIVATLRSMVFGLSVTAFAIFALGTNPALEQLPYYFLAAVAIGFIVFQGPQIVFAVIGGGLAYLVWTVLVLPSSMLWVGYISLVVFAMLYCLSYKPTDEQAETPINKPNGGARLVNVSIGDRGLEATPVGEPEYRNLAQL